MASVFPKGPGGNGSKPGRDLVVTLASRTGSSSRRPLRVCSQCSASLRSSVISPLVPTGIRLRQNPRDLSGTRQRRGDGLRRARQLRRGQAMSARPESVPPYRQGPLRQAGRSVHRMSDCSGLGSVALDFHEVDAGRFRYARGRQFVDRGVATARRDELVVRADFCDRAARRGAGDCVAEVGGLVAVLGRRFGTFRWTSRRARRRWSSPRRPIRWHCCLATAPPSTSPAATPAGPQSRGEGFQGAVFGCPVTDSCRDRGCLASYSGYFSLGLYERVNMQRLLRASIQVVGSFGEGARATG